MPTPERIVAKPPIERLVDLRVLRTRIGASVQSGAPLALLLLALTDELILSLEERIEYAEAANR